MGVHLPIFGSLAAKGTFYKQGILNHTLVGRKARVESFASYLSYSVFFLYGSFSFRERCVVEITIYRMLLINVRTTLIFLIKNKRNVRRKCENFVDKTN